MERIHSDAGHLGAFAINSLSNEKTVPGTGYWNVESDLQKFPEGHYANPQQDVSAVFVPSFVELGVRQKSFLEQIALLDFLLPSLYESDQNTAAAWIGSDDGMIWYHPWADLNEFLPHDFDLREFVFYSPATPNNNPKRQTVWSPVYDDPAGQGLMVTATTPIYVDDEFRGVVGIDVTLSRLNARIEQAKPIANGYLFVVNQEGQALSLPERGYVDFLNRERNESEFGPNLSQSAQGAAEIIKGMMAGEQSFGSVTLSGQNRMFAFTPLSTTGWSVGYLGETDRVLAVVTQLQDQLDTSTRQLVWKRIVPAGVLILIIAMVLGHLLTNRIVAPIRTLAVAAGRLGSGDWNQELPKAGADEIGKLNKAFRNMSHELQIMMEELEQRVAARISTYNRSITRIKALILEAHG